MRNTFPHTFWPHLKDGFLVVFRIWRSTVSEFLESLVNFVRSVNISIINRY